jgi:hypothetical protein
MELPCPFLDSHEVGTTLTGMRRQRRSVGRDEPGRQETASWVLEFQSNLLRLERSNGASSGSVPLHGTAEP